MTAHRAPLRSATFLAHNMLPVYGSWPSGSASGSGRPLEVMVGTSFDQFEHGQVDRG
jgi:hypothetical protein